MQGPFNSWEPFAHPPPPRLGTSLDTRLGTLFFRGRTPLCVLLGTLGGLALFFTPKKGRFNYFKEFVGPLRTKVGAFSHPCSKITVSGFFYRACSPRPPWARKNSRRGCTRRAAKAACAWWLHDKRVAYFRLRTRPRTPPVAATCPVSWPR